MTSPSPLRCVVHALRRLEEQGSLVHDLDAIAALERARLEVHHGTTCDVGVRWARELKPGKQLKKMKFGSYSTHGIRIHPRLDDRRVPQWLIGFVIYHELLHHVLGLEHTPEFRRAERRHPFFELARKWEAARILDLLSASWQPT